MSTNARPSPREVAEAVAANVVDDMTEVRDCLRDAVANAPPGAGPPTPQVEATLALAAQVRRIADTLDWFRDLCAAEMARAADPDGPEDFWRA